MSQDQDNKGKYLLFESAKELFAFDIREVVDLDSTNYIHRLPHKLNSCILGIANIDGEICIILSLAKLLNIDDKFFVEEDMEEKKLIICKNAGSKLAFLVDDIYQLSEAEDSVLEDDEEEDFSAVSSVSVFKVAKLQNKGKTYTILDTELLINALERNYL